MFRPALCCTCTYVSINLSIHSDLPGSDKRILIWDISSASQLCELRGHKYTVYQLVFSRDGALLASGGGDNTVKLWDVAAFVDDDKAMEPLRWLVL